MKINPERQWYETPEGFRQMNLERQTLAEHFPQMQFELNADGNICIYGTIDGRNLLTKSYFLVGLFPSDYPKHELRFYLPHERFSPSTPHLEPDSALSLLIGDEDEASFTADIKLRRSIEWLFWYERFQSTGERW